MIVFLNGRFVPEERAVVSVFDRGFLYGDGLFESILFTRALPFRWDEHMRRLRRGMDFLKLTVSYSFDQLREAAIELIKRNKMPECMVRLSISRGIAERGYSPKNAKFPAVVMTVHAIAPIDPKKMTRWKVVTSSLCLPAGDPLSNFKTANKLTQVLARAEADAAGAQEAILLNTKGQLAEGTTSNIFWVKNNIVSTPGLPSGALPGVTRSVVLELCERMGIQVREQTARPGVLLASDGAFLTMTSFGIVEIAQMDEHKLRHSPLVHKLWRQYAELLSAG